MDDEATKKIESSGPLAVGETGRTALSFARRLDRPIQTTTLPRPIQRTPPDGGEAAPDHRRQESEAPGQDERPARPELSLLMPPPQPVGETSPPPSAMGTETGGGGVGSGESEPRPAAPAKKADATAVADRVYALMQQEIRLGLLRGMRVPGRH